MLPDPALEGVQPAPPPDPPSRPFREALPPPPPPPVEVIVDKELSVPSAPASPTDRD